MATINIIICAAIVIGFYAGYRRGIVKQIGSLVALLVAIMACYSLGDSASVFAAHLMGYDEESGPVKLAMAAAIGRIALFFIVWWGLGLAIRVLHDVIKAIRLGVVNSVAGAVFMVFKVILVVSVILNLWKMKSPDSEQIASGGVLTDAVASVAPALMGYVSDNF